MHYDVLCKECRFLQKKFDPSKLYTDNENIINEGMENKCSKNSNVINSLHIYSIFKNLCFSVCNVCMFVQAFLEGNLFGMAHR